jgi:hypothetical protein
MSPRFEIAELKGGTVLIADRSPQMRAAIRRLFGGAEVVWAEVGTLPDLAAALDRDSPALLIAEDHLLGVGQVLRRIRGRSLVTILSSSGKTFPNTGVGVGYVDRLHLAARLPALVRELYEASRSQGASDSGVPKA